MLAEFVQKLLDSAIPTRFEVDGATFASKQLFEIGPRPDPLKPTVAVHTLTGFADLIAAKLDAFPVSTFAIHIEDYQAVSLVSLASDEHGRRQQLISATPVKFDAFPFGTWMDQESFAIALMARFCETDDRAYVLNVASTLTEEALSISEDSGFTQKATVKQGVKQKAEVILKPTVDLAPFRTFPEVPQPISKFVFRARTGPTLALFEADGGKWKHDAMSAVAQYLKGIGTELPIIA